MEREQKRGGKVKRKEKNKFLDTKAERGDIMANIAKTLNMAKKARDTSTMGSNRIYTNGRSRKDECSDDTLSTESREWTNKSLYHGRGQEGEKELLQL